MQIELSPTLPISNSDLRYVTAHSQTVSHNLELNVYETSYS
jgi:hypothetical protein